MSCPRELPLLLHQYGERRREAVVVQHVGPELEHQAAQAFDRSVHRVLRLVELLIGGELGVILEHHVQPHGRGHHLLDRVVVDVGRDRPALLLLGMHQVGQQLPALLVEPPKVVEAFLQLVGLRGDQ